MYGDGLHELVRAAGAEADGAILNRKGAVLANIGKGGIVAMVSKFTELPGEQILAYYPDGTIKVWADKNAVDTQEALKRYSHPFYLKNQKFTAAGYNLVNWGDLKRDE